MTAGIILPVIYRKPEITAASYLLWPLALAVICEAMRVASSMSLLATRRTRVVFFARIVSLATFLCGGLALGYLMGFVGILWASAFGSAAGAAVVVGAALRIKART
jgi:O-antigen/teichoic acid export membrane protein